LFSFSAFVLPFLERLLYRPRDVASIRVLVITPTRELAQQIHVVLEKLAQVNIFVICCHWLYCICYVLEEYICIGDIISVLYLPFNCAAISISPHFLDSQYTDVTSILICGGKKDVRSQEASLRQRPDVVVSRRLFFVFYFSFSLVYACVLTSGFASISKVYNTIA